jgi:two-component system, sensor histidine kinase
MLRRILQNLLTNAVQYTDRGGIKLAARRRGQDVRVEVWDTGPGIPASDQDMIFEEFQRGPSPDRLSIGGFGLGLSIVQRMAEALGHPVGLCSRVGHGTRFSITAPFAGTVDSTAERAVPVSCGATYGLSGTKVLVIDNDQSVLEAMQSLLQRWACEVVLVRDIAEIDRIVTGAGQTPDIVLADYHLDRGACGVSAVEKLRAAAGDPELPAIIITADHSPAIADKAHASRCELLLKPVKPAELRALMHHLVRRPANARQDQAPF